MDELHYKIVTDHRPLMYIFNIPSSKLTMRIERWNMYLQEFDFVVEYKPGKNNPQITCQGIHEGKI